MRHLVSLQVFGKMDLQGLKKAYRILFFTFNFSGKEILSGPSENFVHILRVLASSELILKVKLRCINMGFKMAQLLGVKDAECS